jgi:DNA processing protein
MLDAFFRLDLVYKTYILFSPMDACHYALALCSVGGVGSVTYKKLIGRFGSAEAVFGASKRDLTATEGLSDARASAITSFRDWEAVQQEVRRAEDEGVGIISLEDDRYPARLKEIYDAPPVLYVKGSLEAADSLAVAVVGSRNSTRYGTICAESIARGLAQRGITVVSGMARGIDSGAHVGALRGPGRTIAVLGSGIDVIYPAENRALYQEIVEHGAVITELPMGAEPETGNFPKRNRIISGLCLGVVIVEASVTSGALITAKLALDQNREVFAVPGNITSMRSRGTHALIQQGARLVESAEDVIAELAHLLARDPHWSGAGQEKRADPYEGLSEKEAAVLRLIENGPVYVDTIIEEGGLKSDEVLAILLDLEMKRLVRQIGGGQYVMGAA